MAQSQEDKAMEPNPDTSPLQKDKQIAIEPEAVAIRDIKPTHMNKAIEVKVYRKWTAKTIPDLTHTMYCILLDKKGDAIQANIDHKYVQKYNELQLNSVYWIQGFGSYRTKKWQQTLDNNLTLFFGKFTKLSVIPDEGFLEHYFRFVAYNELGRKAHTRDSMLTDYIVIICEINEKKSTVDATTNVIPGRNI